jgi:hypothetical protein
MPLPKTQWGPVAIWIQFVSTYNHIARIADHGDDMQMPIDSQPWPHYIEINRALGEVDVGVLPMLV